MNPPTPNQATAVAGQRLVELASAIAHDEEYSAFPWTGLVVIATMRWAPLEHEGVRRFTGYLYTETPLMAESGGEHCWQAATPSRGTGPAFVALAKAIAVRDGKEPWKHCLFQLDRNSGAVNVEFSYEDNHSWNPDFGDLDGWVERLRPLAGRKSE